MEVNRKYSKYRYFYTLRSFYRIGLDWEIETFDTTLKGWIPVNTLMNFVMMGMLKSKKDIINELGENFYNAPAVN